MGDWVIPITIAGILGFAMIRQVRVFDVFLEGAREGLQTTWNILPALVGLVFAVGMLRASGALELICIVLAPLGRLLGLPQEVLPLAILRPISGSGALAIYSEILKFYGADSTIGRIASVMQGSTETTFYTIALYYSAAQIRNIRHTIPASLCADITGFFCAALFVRLLMKA